MSFWDQVVANPQFWLSASALLSVTAILCLLALWAATATKGRLERVVIVWIAIMVLVPIRAYEPALMFTLIAGLVIVLVRMIRFVTRDRSAGERWWSGWFRFSLADIFTLTLFVCTTLAMGALCCAHPAQYFTGTLWTLPIPIVVTLSHFAAAGPYRVRMVICTVSALAATAGFAIWARLAPHFPSPRGMSQYEALQACLHGLLLGLHILLAYFVVLLLRILWTERRTPRHSKLRMGALLGLSLVATLLAFVAWYYCTDMLRSLPVAGRNLIQIAWAASPLAVLAVIVAGATALAPAWRGDWGRRWQRACVTASGGAALTFALPLAWLYCQMLWLPPIPPFASAGPTNYDRLVAIARQLRDLYQPRGGSQLGSKGHALLDEASALLKAPNYIPAAALEADAKRPYPESAFHHRDLFAVM